jgi:hypothetical protein
MTHPQLRTVRAASLVLATAAAAMVALPASAATVRFGALAGTSASDFTSLIEDGFQVERDTRFDSWTTVPAFGDTGASVRARSGNRLAGLIVTAVDGGAFQFRSIDLSSVARASSSVPFSLVGDLLGVTQFTQLGSVYGDGLASPFTTFASSQPATSITRLTITFLESNFAGVSRGTGMVDNITLEPLASASVPTPATLGLVALAIAGLLLTHPRRARH